MRSILVHVADDECLESKLQVGLDLARAFGGHLTCLQAMPFEYGVPGDFYGAYLAALVPEIREDEQKLRERCEQRLSVEDVSWSLEHPDGAAAEHLIRKGALSDVIVLGACDPYGKGPPQLAADVLMRGRSPIFLVPEHTRSLDCTAPTLVAWNGSAEASHALRAAVPLLARAQSVVLATIAGEPDKTIDLPGAEAAEYLSRHGVSCELVELPLEGRPVARALADAAAVRGCSYLVMGAWGHWRVAETIFGGVTRELFSDPPLPIFACH